MFNNDEKKILEKYITNLDSNVFVLKNLPEVVKGALFSRYSRSDKSLKRLLLDEFILNKDLNIFAEVNKERAEKFYERVLIGYGDDSVGELSSIHVAIEDISNIVSKIIEDSRIGISPLEKSTRYVYFDKKKDGRYLYYFDDEMERCSKNYEQTMDFLFDTYTLLLKEIRSHLLEKYPKTNDISDRVYNNTIKAKSCDIVRGLLPMATLTNVGLRGNGRAFEYLIVKLRAMKMPETDKLAKKLFDEISNVLPSFVKRSFNEKGDMWVEYLNNERNLFSKFNSLNSSETTQVKLVRVNGNEDDVIAGIIYMYSSMSYSDCLTYAKQMTYDEKKELINKYLNSRKNRRHKPSRAFELVDYTFDIISNLGAYRDLQRHRILTHIRQSITPYLGYTIPNEIEEINRVDLWNEAMKSSYKLYEEMKTCNKQLAQYVIPFAYRVRYLLKMNLREAFHFSELRSGEQGHIDYRLIAIKIAHEIKRVHPLIGYMKFLNEKHVDLERLNAEKRIEEKRKRIIGNP